MGKIIAKMLLGMVAMGYADSATQMVKQEVRREVRYFSKVTLRWVLSLFFGLAAVVFVLVAAYTGLREVMQPAYSALIMAVILAILAFMITRRGERRVTEKRVTVS